jgi:hypothetical protein
MFAMMEGSSPPPPCGATLRFLDNENNEISPETKALNVSNYVTSVDLPLPGDTEFESESVDPSNFRLEVEDEEAEGDSVTVSLKVGDRDAIEYTLDKKSGNKFRGKFLRLVTDDDDDAVQGTQTVLCRLGETVVLTYHRAGEEECEDQLTIGIGRPTDEDDNGADQLKHDIRELKVHVVVFSTPGTTQLNGAIDAAADKIKVDDVANAHSSGVIKIEDEVIEYTGIDTDTKDFTGCTRGVEGTAAAAHADDTDVLYSTTTPVLTRAQVATRLEATDQRFAQATIRLARDEQGNVPLDMGGEGDPGKPLPSAMLDDFTRSPNPHTLATLTDEEKAIVGYSDGDDDSIDAFIVRRITKQEDGTEVGGNAFIKAQNQTGDAAYQNFVIIRAANHRFTLAHECMHVLLDAGHPRAMPDDPDTSLFYAVAPSSGVGGTKRIGPYPNDGPGSNATNDTHEIRETVESLPQ